MKTRFNPLLLLAVAAIVWNCRKPSSMEEGTTPSLSPDAAVDLATQAYIFGYPIVVMDVTRRSSTNVEKPVPGQTLAPVNQFGHNHTFPDATFSQVVKPNCDTYYSTAWLDLKQEPIVLSVPNTQGRYYLMPIMDAYTNVFASPGKRTTGTEAKTFVITGPDYKGSIPEGMTEIKSPTNMGAIIGRTQVNSKADGEKVVTKIQDGYKLTPLSKYGTTFVWENNKVDTTLGDTPPPQVVKSMSIETFFNKLNQLMSDNPPAQADSSLVAKLGEIGVGPGKEFVLTAFDTATQRKLKMIPQQLHDEMRKIGAEFGVLENGWSMKRSGVGSYGTNYEMRAAIAMFGLGANLNADASYPGCVVDEKGDRLNGAKKYVIHFNKGQTPPANAFWSITMYGPDDLLIANPINRFAIGDRDKLKYNADGSLDIYIQHDSPGKAKESNWLPAGKDNFTLTMRLYWPKEDFFNGQWKIPPVSVVN